MPKKHQLFIVSLGFKPLTQPGLRSAKTHLAPHFVFFVNPPKSRPGLFTQAHLPSRFAPIRIHSYLFAGNLFSE